MAQDGIYVEVRVAADVETIWRYTQEPQVHELWDLRFTSIRYLAHPDPSEPQRFLYSTKIGFGLEINGEGESTGSSNRTSGEHTSALRFWSDDPRSLIREGSGYWRYISTPEGARFLTWYDYRTRFGAPGRIFDRYVFRPLIGWATAWSFDRLRLWIEQGLHPRSAMRLTVIHALCRAGVAFVWFWQGLAPKLLYSHVDEKLMLAAATVPLQALPLIGWLEIAFAAATLLLWRWSSFFLWNAIAMLTTLAMVAVISPEYLSAAFNPVSLNASMIVLSLIGFVAGRQLPSAAHCLRRPEDSH